MSKISIFLQKLIDVDAWEEIWHTIAQNKSRSVLTAFGVFWGMFMLVVLVGSGMALKNGISKNFDGFATNSCFVWANQISKPYKGLKAKRNWNMNNADLPVLINNIPEIEYISPILYGGSSSNNVTRREFAGSYQVRGLYPTYNKIFVTKVIMGRNLNDIDIVTQRKVCVIGERIYKVLFPTNENPIGQSIKVNGIYFNVVGVLQKISNMDIGGGADETVQLPFTTMQQAFNMGEIVHSLAITAKTGVKVKVIQDKVETILKERHNIAPDDEKAVSIFNVEEIFTMFLYLGIGIASLIWIVGLGTLFAGAVGVSNIMLVTVRERTREIGIKRALGATPRSIIVQVISESIILTLIAGIIGLLFGVGILVAVGVLLKGTSQIFDSPQISFSVAVFALIILIVIGTLAGLLPANRAMNIKPIEAIRED